MRPLINGPTVDPVGDRCINMWEARNNKSQKQNRSTKCHFVYHKSKTDGSGIKP